MNKPAPLPAGFHSLDPPSVVVRLALLTRIRDLLAPYNEETGYGYYRPPNPHDFHPDSELCTQPEIDAHKAACEAWDKGEYVRDDWDGWNDDHTCHVLIAPWGIGSYVMRSPEITAAIAEINKLIPETYTP